MVAQNVSNFLQAKKGASTIDIIYLFSLDFTLEFDLMSLPDNEAMSFEMLDCSDFGSYQFITVQCLSKGVIYAKIAWKAAKSQDYYNEGIGNEVFPLVMESNFRYGRLW